MTREWVTETASTGSGQGPRADTTASTQPSDELLALLFRRKRGQFLAGVLSSAIVLANPASVVTAPPAAIVRREGGGENDTSPVEVASELVEQVREVFERGADEFFQDGMESNFSRELLSFVAQHGRSAFEAMLRYVYSGQANPDSLGEALRWIADFDDPATLAQRWSLLRRSIEYG